MRVLFPRQGRDIGWRQLEGGELLVWRHDFKPKDSGYIWSRVEIVRQLQLRNHLDVTAKVPGLKAAYRQLPNNLIIPLSLSLSLSLSRASVRLLFLHLILPKKKELLQNRQCT